MVVEIEVDFLWRRRWNVPKVDRAHNHNVQECKFGHPHHTRLKIVCRTKEKYYLSRFMLCHSQFLHQIGGAVQIVFKCNLGRYVDKKCFRDMVVLKPFKSKIFGIGVGAVASSLPIKIVTQVRFEGSYSLCKDFTC